MSSTSSPLVQRVSERDANRGAHKSAQQAVTLRTTVWLPVDAIPKSSAVSVSCLPTIQTEGHYFPCRNLPLSNDVISAFESRDYLQCGVWEELTSFAKEFAQALFVGELQFERLIVKCEAVVESFHYFRNPPVTQSSQR